MRILFHMEEPVIIATAVGTRRRPAHGGLGGVNRRRETRILREIHAVHYLGDSMGIFYEEPPFDHGQGETLGILLVNLGTPDAPTPRALRTYLREFLWDPRIVDTPRWLWWLILNGIILNTRPRRSAHAYQQIWTDRGSPLYTFSLALASKLQQRLDKDLGIPVQVQLAMRYGNPSVAVGLERLKEVGARHILVLPLYPQYSATTTGSTFDAIAGELRRWRWVPELRFVNQYHDHPVYIQALAQSISTPWSQWGQPDKLLFSFHGMPQRYHLAGDPYYCQCRKTARLVAQQLQLADDAWAVSFQSLFGREQWLQPYTQPLLEQWAQQGIGKVDVICPGFSADCLETLEEIAGGAGEAFLARGGKSFNYIPALNDSEGHIDLMLALIRQHIQGWPCATADYPGFVAGEQALRRQRAQADGAVK